MPRRFWSRSEAGTLLAQELRRFKDAPGVLVLAIPRGGAPVAFEVARKLGAPLDVLIAAKLSLPGSPPPTLGAVARGGVRTLRTETIADLGVAPAVVDQLAAAGEAEVARREHALRGWKKPLDLHGRTVILVDDGIATGATMTAAVASTRRHGAERLIIAVPVVSEESRETLRQSVSELVCLHTPSQVPTVSACYDQFPRVNDEDIRELLGQARQEPTPSPLFDLSSFASAASS